MAAAGAAAGIQHLGSPFTMSLASMASLASLNAAAADFSTGYRALVCLYMSGGSDSHNWVVPIDTTGYNQYANARRELAWRQDALLPITCTSQANGRAFGMPTELTALRDLYEAGDAAILANVGPLTRPITKTEFNNGVALPSKLFSHNDQACTWQSLSPEGARSGWGGRMGDVLAAGNQNPVFTAISVTGNAVFLSGNQVVQYQVGTEGPISVRALGANSVFYSGTAPAVLRKTITAPGLSDIQFEYAKVMQRSLDAGSKLQTALSGVSVPSIPRTTIPLSSGTTTLDTDPLAKQLQMVAKLVAAGQSLGMRRQVFMVSMGGFDSHANQMRDQPSLMSRVALSVSYFMSALAAVGLQDRVTLFTASDFGRTLTTNGQGSDHGWGSHHFVVGGAVKGRNIYGNFPVTALGTPEDVGSGRLLPTTSVTQHAATLGRWMGLSDTELLAALPGLDQFTTRNLGYL